MEDFSAALSAALALFKMEFTLWGFTFSFWEVFCFVVIASIIAWIIGEVFLGD